MDRRRFLLTSLAGALAAPLVAEALQAGKVYRIGVLRTSFSPPTPDPHLDALRQGLHALGYVEGKNITLEVRWAEGRSDRFAGLAAELVRLGVDAIVVTHTETALAVMEKTRIIPIVMATSFDAVADGLVVSLARPGGNVTGLSLLIPEMSLKRLELLNRRSPPCLALSCCGRRAEYPAVWLGTTNWRHDRWGSTLCRWRCVVPTIWTPCSS
jgi:ABC-type uncharacterized transport system substrate-binding protein